MFIKQYELWQTCNNNCSFCFNKGEASILDPLKQELALRSVIKDLDLVYEKHGKDVSIELIGGDFFQGQLSTPTVKTLFFDLIKKIKLFGDTGKIRQVVIFATLTEGDQEDLYSTLDILLNNKKSDFDIWVSTSYDTRGRFTTESKLKNWKYHMSKLSKINNVHLNTTIIFTQDFIKKVLSNDFDMDKFQKEYNTTLFFKHPLPIMINGYYTHGMMNPRDYYLKAKKELLSRNDWFMPLRKDALRVMSIMNNLGILDRLMGLNYRADDLDSKFSDSGEWLKTVRDKSHNIESTTEEKSSCGHLLTYMCYADSDKCLLCDKENILNE